MTKTPNLQFGRSWFVQLKISTLEKSAELSSEFSLEPFKFYIQLRKPVDPLSGMTINLMAVDETWAQAQDLVEKTWPSPVEFLNVISKRWHALMEHEKAQLIFLKTEDLNGFGWELTSEGLHYKTMIRAFSRKVLLTSQKKLEESELKDFSNQSKLSLSKNPLLLRIEVLDPFEQFVEFDSH